MCLNPVKFKGQDRSNKWILINRLDQSFMNTSNISLVVVFFFFRSFCHIKYFIKYGDLKKILLRIQSVNIKRKPKLLYRAYLYLDSVICL